MSVQPRFMAPTFSSLQKSADQQGCSQRPATHAPNTTLPPPRRTPSLIRTHKSGTKAVRHQGTSKGQPGASVVIQSPRDGLSTYTLAGVDKRSHPDNSERPALAIRLASGDTKASSAQVGHSQPSMLQPMDQGVPRSRSKRISTKAACRGPYRPKPTSVQGYKEYHNHRISTAKPSATITRYIAKNSIFPDAQHVSISGSTSLMNIGGDNVTTVNNCEGKHGLGQIEKFVSFSAQYDSSAQDPDSQCHPGTRKHTLTRIQDWIDDIDGFDRIFWLHGPAGAGKSSIAKTIAHSYGRPKIAASFFFFRSDPSRNDGNLLFTTLAYQLALSIPGIRNYIIQSLHERPDLPRTNVETQFDNLIAHPFRNLSEDASHQLTPLEKVDPIKKCQQLAPIVIIDGVNECADEKLQRRFLSVINDAIRDDRFPLRFLIASRSEAHIEETINLFPSPVLHINLAKLDDANRDIEKYLVDHFSRIASNQGLRQAWPGQEIINDIVCKSSGNFILASVIVVGDEDESAESQLNIILNLKRSNTKSPFATLDAMYLEILRRLPDQDFLKRFLDIFVARISLSIQYDKLYKDDAVLMLVSEKELHIKLRRMRSLLEFKPYINVYHLSFPDFLQEQYRSCEYYVQGGIKRYMELFVDSLVHYVSIVIERPDYHKLLHFNPGFRRYITEFPTRIRLSVKEWQEVLQPLLDLQERLLKRPDVRFTWDLLSCDECTVFCIMRELLLYLALLQGTSIEGAESDGIRERSSNSSPLILTEIRQDMPKNDLDRCLSSLLAHLQGTKFGASPDTEITGCMCDLLRVNQIEIAVRVRSISDAQRLLDLLVYLIDEKYILKRIGPNATCKAIQLAFQIFSRIPVLPHSFALNGDIHPHRNSWSYDVRAIEVLCQTAFAGRLLDPSYVVPVLGAYQNEGKLRFVGHEADESNLPIMQWRRRSNPGFTTTIQVVIGVAKAIRYLHSMRVILDFRFDTDDVFLDSELRPKIRYLCSTSRPALDSLRRKLFAEESNVLSFGRFFYTVYFNIVLPKPIGVTEHPMWRIVILRPPKPNIPDCAWQLIERCCAEVAKSRPTMNEVVQEMAAWEID